MKKNCPYFKECGGCNKLDLSYEAEIEEKEALVAKLFKRVNYTKKIEVVKSDSPFYYRNKVQLAFKLSKTHQVVSGIYEEHSHKIVTVNDCLIQAETINRVVNNVNKALTKNKIMPYANGGVLKHVLIRYGFKSNEIMIVLVTISDFFPGSKNFIKSLLELEPQIKTIVQNIQPRDTSIVLGPKEKILYGKGFIIDELCGLKFKISPKSFYQINPMQTERLYTIAIDFADIRKDDIILDAYSGIGTIGMTAARKAKKVFCVENNADAVRDAKFNSIFNNINNVQFFCEDSTRFLMNLADNKNNKIDVLFLDPPRSGTTKEFINAIYKMQIKRVVYVSCDPNTLVRDLAIFKELGYAISKVKCVDMFPRTSHVETACLLTLKNQK